MANLFTSQTPSTTNASDGTPGIVTATSIKTAVDGTITGIRFYATTTVGGTYTALLYRVDTADPGSGTLLASKVAGAAPTGGTWNTITFDTPVDVVSTELYRACIHNNDGRYVATSNFFTGGGGGLTNGDLFAPPNGDDPVGIGAISQGTFDISATPVYPNDTFSAACYFVDVEFTADGVDAAAPNGLAVPVGLGAPASTAVISAAPNGIAASVTLGAPAVTAVGAAPDGLAVSVTLGAPSVVPPAVPDGLAVPVGLGAPASTAVISVAPDGIALPVALGEPSIVAAAGPSGIAVTIQLGAPTVTRLDTDRGGWGTLAGVIAGARQDARMNAQRRRNPIDCPVHGWPLDRAPNGVLHCQFGGHVVVGSN